MGIDCISTGIRRIVESEDPIQTMANYVIMGRADVCRGLRGYVFRINSCKNPAYVGKCKDPILRRDDLLERANFPYVVIDCSLFNLHSEKEKRKIVLQVQQSLGVVRKFMWDEMLVVTHKDLGFGLYYPSTSDFIRDRGLRRVILLDPNGDCIFKGQKADCYIVGGIVDKSGEKRGWTSKIRENLEKEGVDVESMRIELRGDVVGVPDRINTIVEIVLRVVLDGEDVENAVRSVQSNLVARWRLRKEIPKRTIRIDVKRPFRVVRKSEFENFKWLNLRKKDFYDVCSELGYLVLDDEWLERILRFSSYDGRRYIFKV